MAVLILAMAWFRKRLFLGIVHRHVRVGHLQSAFLGLWDPVPHGRGLVLVRAYRLQKKLRLAGGGSKAPTGRRTAACLPLAACCRGPTSATRLPREKMKRPSKPQGPPDRCVKVGVVIRVRPCGGAVASRRRRRSSDDERHQEGERDEQDQREHEHAERRLLRFKMLSGDTRAGSFGTTVAGNGRAHLVEGGAGEALGVAGAVDGEGAGARVPGRIAAAAPHEPEAVGDGDGHRDAVVVESVDLAVLVDAGHGEDDDESGQGDQTEADDDLTDLAGVVVDARPPQRREGLIGRSGRPEGPALPERSSACRSPLSVGAPCGGAPRAPDDGSGDAVVR